MNNNIEFELPKERRTSRFVPQELLDSPYKHKHSVDREIAQQIVNYESFDYYVVGIFKLIVKWSSLIIIAGISWIAVMKLLEPFMGL